MRSLLIANRGEIACRIARTARRMGIGVVAVYSDADAGALHVRLADTAVRIGPAPAAGSYLDIAAILAAAAQSGADAVHPGYGFLSENADFAEAVRRAGLIFVGPSAESISRMGDKRAAKELARAAAIPVVPGYDGSDQDDATLAREAERIGWPLLVKAAAGGGGRGMRVAAGARDFLPALESARREAKSAFGSDAVLLERLIEHGRHVEVQVFGDRQGNCVHLFERDCTSQRRHQKIIEEAPSPSVDEALRTQLGAWAVALAKSAKYENAGTVEFLLDARNQPHFLEMNTRLQVEHPVTERITGLDLVEWQLRVARGEPLPLRQEQIRRHGHAIEARLYAEDPAQDFLPQTGIVRQFALPDAAVQMQRIDAGVSAGDAVSAHYDPMIAKFIASGPTREDARRALCVMLGEAAVVGVATNSGFLVRLLESGEFAQSTMTTRTIDGWLAERSDIFSPPPPTAFDFACAALVLALAPGGSWFRSSGHEELPIDLSCAGVAHTVLLEFSRGQIRRASIGQNAFAVEDVAWSSPWLALATDGQMQRHRFVVEDSAAILFRDGFQLRFAEPDLLAPAQRARDPRWLVSPVSGIASSVSVAAGDPVRPGDIVAVIEAMKMETRITAAASGVVTAVRVVAGSQVAAGDVIAEIAPQAPPESSSGGKTNG